MALINCPECSKEISDKVKSCPHCGFPMEETEETQKVEISSINLKVDTKKRKKIVTSVIYGVLAIVLLFEGYSIYNSNKTKNLAADYKSNVELLLIQMISSGAKAEELMNLTAKVWANAIYEDSDSETDKYTKPNGYFVSDFNTALQNLFVDSSVVDTISSIEGGEKLVDETMKKLQEPPDQYSKLYDTIMELYSSYQGITSLAVSPKGSLQTFGNNRNEKIDEFMELYKKVEAQLK